MNDPILNLDYIVSNIVTNTKDILRNLDLFTISQVICLVYSDLAV